MPPAIKVENLSKSYLVGHNSAQGEKYTALRDVVSRNARNLARKTRDMFSGRQIVQGDEVEEFWALKDINFEIQSGERVGIIGRNGAGKSTLLKILSRITEPTRGRVTIHGRVASLLEVGTGFHPELTGRENIFLNGAILGMSRKEIQRKFDEIVDFAEVEKFLDTPVKRYSSGMYVRLAFAVAAHLDPEILVVDEVLAVGDTSFQKKCLGKMESVSKDTGRTVLFVSHNLAAISKLCSSAIVLRSGCATSYGSVDCGIKDYLSAYAINPQGTHSTWNNKNLDGELSNILHSCGCSQIGANDGATLMDDADINIWMSLITKQRTNDFQIALILTNESGEVIIHTQTDTSENTRLHKQERAGRIAYRIPRRSLRQGRYFVSIYGLVPNVARVFAHEDVISFTVEPSNSAVTRHANSAWRGAFSPCFGEWVEDELYHPPT